MRGLRKVLTPFAPDQSGAVSVLYSLGGLIVVIDAGGCTGNICGFDEPRWQGAKSAIFSAGLRDMDAILGRDELLVKKTIDAASRIDCKFIALVGTPVPATIATDYKALKRMMEKKTDLPILTIPANGMRLYDEGEAMAYRQLAEVLGEEGNENKEESETVIGQTPLTYGMDYKDVSLEQMKLLGNSKIIAASASGVSFAESMGLRYEAKAEPAMKYLTEDLKGKVLVCHDEVFGKTLRDNGVDLDIATFFTLHDSIAREGDRKISEEDDFTKMVLEGGYDTVVADEILRELIPDFKGKFIDAPCFAISGRH
ncbi:MAG: nitrogenase molybdenum-iron protein [Saccharofermentans sp.]|nr:nitrogenase molybdenum-iron protein [Saccharofermentans sp.]